MLLLPLVLGAIVCWTLASSVYQLWFSPLAGIPGPKLAAVTLLYEFYYEAICLGKFTRHIETLHQRYGLRPLPARLIRGT